jgi:type VI secretion system protein
LELRKGKEQFEKEVGVAVSGARGTLQRARGVEEVLRYLMETGEANARRPDELIRAFAEVMIHHVALLNGVREGARGLLAQLNPQALDAHRAQGRGPKPGALQLLRDQLFPAYARWRAFLARHQELVEEEGPLTAALFGPEFARAYASVASDAVDADTRPKGKP